MDFLASLNTLSNGQLLFIGLLIFAAVLIFPHLIRRKNIQRCILEKNKKGEIIRPEDFAGKNQKLFFTHNARSSEIEELLVKLKTYAFKHEMKIVFPGSFPYNGKNSDHDPDWKVWNSSSKLFRFWRSYLSGRVPATLYAKYE